MPEKWYERVTGPLDDKRRWREYKARTRRLPAPYRAAVDGIERYLMHTGPGDGPGLVAMCGDLADLFERAAIDGTPVRAVVGDDPVDFVELFKQNYGIGRWLSKEQQRLIDAIAQAESAQQEGP